MTDHGDGAPRGSEAVVTHERRIGLVWLIPIVAAAIGAWLAVDTYLSRGPTYTIRFESADGLVAGKTMVKYKAVEIGQVDSIRLSRDYSHVVVTCTALGRDAFRLTEGAKFWVVRPRIGAAGISGLGTLVSGAYIAALPGSPGGKATYEFTGLETPPVAPADAPGLKLTLHAEDLGSLDVGSPVLHRQLQAGSVEAYRMAEDGRSVLIDIYVSPKYAKLVGPNTQFWNASGLDVQAGFGGVDIRSSSLASLVLGGIAFGTGGDAALRPLGSGTEFWLHADRKEMEQARYRYGGMMVVVEAAELGGIQTGDHVLYRGEAVGAVAAHGLSSDRNSVRVHLNIQHRFAPLVRTNSVFWNASGVSSSVGLRGLHIHAESLQAVLSGGVAFANPPDAGAPVAANSVFRLHREAKDEWLAWSSATLAPVKEGLVARVFHHHRGKDPKEAAADQDPAQPDPARSAKHGFFSKLLHPGSPGS